MLSSCSTVLHDGSPACVAPWACLPLLHHHAVMVNLAVACVNCTLLQVAFVVRWPVRPSVCGCSLLGREPDAWWAEPPRHPGRPSRSLQLDPSAYVPPCWHSPSLARGFASFQAPVPAVAQNHLVAHGRARQAAPSRSALRPIHARVLPAALFTGPLFLQARMAVMGRGALLLLVALWAAMAQLSHQHAYLLYPESRCVRAQSELRGAAPCESAS